MNLVTLTVDLDTHVVVPKIISEDMSLKMAMTGWVNTRQGVLNAIIAAAPPYPELNSVESLDSWISVKDRNPPIGTKVLVYFGIFQDPNDTCNYSESYLIDAVTWMEDGCEVIEPKFWMNLPAAPKGGE
jgi:hypothetical protein